MLQFHYHSLFTLVAPASIDIALPPGGRRDSTQQSFIRGGFAPRSNALNPEKDTPFGRSLPL